MVLFRFSFFLPWLDGVDLENLYFLQIASFEGELSVTKYLNSFPFPYYIVLKNLDALPRTLADLLRQVMLSFCMVLFLFSPQHSEIGKIDMSTRL